MTQTSSDISQQLQAQLKILDPDLAVNPLSPERKIIDSVAETLAESQSDQFVLSYQLDIDSKIGSDLDSFIALFGFARQGGTRSTGTVTFFTNLPATSDISIPVGTTLTVPPSSVTQTVTFYTTSTVTLYAGTLSADAPVEAAEIGTSGNVPALSISVYGASSSTLITSVSNAVATSGGSDLETDAELRLRFKNTIFRNVAGTTSQYLALALADQFTNKATVIEPINRFIEYLQIPASLVVTSQIPYSKYTYNFDYYLTQNDTVTGGVEVFFTPGVDYSFSNTAPPSFTVLHTDPTRDFIVGSIVLLEHSYCSENSRNDPINNIQNYVDIYLSGDNDQDIIESVLFPTNQIFTSTSGTYYTSNYRRTFSRSAPATGNTFQSLLWQPAVDIASAITVNGTTFYENVDYWLVEDTTVYKGSKRARNGIEWKYTAASTIGSGTAFQADYTFNVGSPGTELEFAL